MATTAATLRAERWLDEVLIDCAIPNTMGDDFVELFTLPPGIGDVAILEIEGSFTTLATVVSPTNLGILAHVLSADEASVLDIIGVAPVRQISASALAAYWSPDPLVLWRQNERLTFRGPELDSNAVPTGDFGARVKAVRVRPIEGAPPRIQLVR